MYSFEPSGLTLSRLAFTIESCRRAVASSKEATFEAEKMLESDDPAFHFVGGWNLAQLNATVSEMVDAVNRSLKCYELPIVEFEDFRPGDSMSTDEVIVELREHLTMIESKLIKLYETVRSLALAKEDPESSDEDFDQAIAELLGE